MSLRSWVIRIWVVGLFFVGTFGWNVAAHAQPRYFNYNTNAIVSAIQNRHSDLVIVVAHRGLHAILDNNNNACCSYTNPPTGFTIDYSNTPENSLQSIYNAASAGIEVIELDVRTTQDNVPILSHDSTWGRETNVGNNYNSCCFNPYGPLPGLTASDGDPGALGGGADAPTDSQAYRNPNITDWSLYSVQQSNGGIQLRNSANFSWSTWNENPPTLQNALDYIKQNQLNVVISLDVKNGADLQAAWNVVSTNNDYHGNNYYSTVIFKYDAAYNFAFPGGLVNTFAQSYNVCRTGGFCNGSIYNDGDYIKVMPVFQTSGIASNLYGSEQNELAAMQAYANNYNTVGMEVNLKENPGILSSLYNWGDSGATSKALADFNPYKEYVAPGADPTNYFNYQYYYSNGYCCAFLNQYFYNGTPDGNRPSDTQDQRPDWGFILANRNGFNFITTDNPLAMGMYLYNRGQRNTSYFYSLD